jgi:hypothetical protein
MVLGEKIFEQKSKNILFETYIPFLSEWYIFRFIWYYLSLPTLRTLPFVEKKEDMRRESFHFDITEIKSNYISCEKISSKFYVIYHLLTHIYDEIGVNRPIRVLIPIAFKTNERSYNNVGCIMMDFTKEQPIESFVKEIRKLEYQAHATNILQQMMNSGKKARNSVDVVLSLGFFEYETDIVENMYVTYENIADYPVYCISITYKNKVFSTITYMNKR